MSSGVIYLDNAASTPVDPGVAALMHDVLTGPAFGNPSAATHEAGLGAARLIARARAQVAALIGAEPAQIIFTSGATEADNLAVLGTARALAHRGRHIVSARTEHKAVLDALKRLEREGWVVSWLAPGPEGVVTPEAVASALRPDTVLVTLMHVNNETGIVQDIAAIGAVCRERGIVFHTDAVQGAGRLPLDVSALPVDLLTLSAHKLHGPKGIGALYVRAGMRAPLQPLLFGGGQEGGLRSGTQPTHQIAGFGLACELASDQLADQQARISALRDRFLDGLSGLAGVRINGIQAPRVPHIVSVCFDDVNGESLVAALPGVAVATGAACNSAQAEPSGVLRALGCSVLEAESSLRFSFGRFTTAAEVDAAAEQVREAVAQVRSQSPARGWPEAEVTGTGEAYGSVVRGEVGGPAQDTWIRFQVGLRGDTVTGARYRVRGCPHTVAAVAWVAGHLAGRSRGDAVPGTPQDWARELGTPVEKLGQLLLVEDALRAALASPPGHGL